MKRFFSVLLLSLVFTLTSCHFPAQENPDRAQTLFATNAKQHLEKPYVILISIDGFRHDYLQMFKPPNLEKLVAQGSRAESLIPIFPSLTFPNHYAIATGRYAENNGIVGNFFYDEKSSRHYKMGDETDGDVEYWYQGEPIWAAAERNGMLAGTYFWVGSSAKFDGRRSTFYKDYDGNMTNNDRVDEVLGWLSSPKEHRPHLVTLYFSDVDSAGHKYGPTAKETRTAVQNVDAAIGRLMKGVEQFSFGVNIIVVSDHGMDTLDNNKVIYLSQFTDLKPFVTTERGAMTQFYSDDPKAIDKAYADLKKAEKNFRVFKRHEIPVKYHMSKSDRTGDLVVVADLHYYLKAEYKAGDSLNKATHGWDPFVNKSLHGIFFAAGPNIKQGLVVPSFENVNIFPMITKILDIQPTQPYDGDVKVLEGILH